VLTQIDAKGSETQYKYDDVARSIRMTTRKGSGAHLPDALRGDLDVTTGIGPTDPWQDHEL